MLKRGMVVKSLAGRDRGYLLTVIKAEGNRIFVCDGKERPIDRPKCKNIRHVMPTKFFVSDEEMATDRALKKALRRIEADNDCND